MLLFTVESAVLLAELLLVTLMVDSGKVVVLLKKSLVTAVSVVVSFSLFKRENILFFSLSCSICCLSLIKLLTFRLSILLEASWFSLLFRNVSVFKLLVLSIYDKVLSKTLVSFNPLVILLFDNISLVLLILKVSVSLAISLVAFAETLSTMSLIISFSLDILLKVFWY